MSNKTGGKSGRLSGAHDRVVSDFLNDYMKANDGPVDMTKFRTALLDMCDIDATVSNVKRAVFNARMKVDFININGTVVPFDNGQQDLPLPEPERDRVADALFALGTVRAQVDDLMKLLAA